MEKSSLTPTLLVLGVICAIFAGCATTDEATAEEPETKRVLLLMRHGNESMHSLYGVDTDDVLTNEVGVMRTMLQEAGLEVVVAAAGREPLEGTTQVLQPDTIFQVVRLRDYHGVIIPCLCLGSLSTRWHALGDEITLVRHAVAAGLPVAAQKGAIIILAEAGICICLGSGGDQPSFPGSVLFRSRGRAGWEHHNLQLLRHRGKQRPRKRNT
jgi:hypothetical protein